APTHHAEAWPYLVAELPLDVVEVLRQVAIAADTAAEDVGDQFLVGRTIKHGAFVPVGDAQHLLAVILVAPALLPKLGRLDRRHQHLERTRRVLLLADDLLDLLQ